jgi:hypothetical protein
MGNLFIAMKLVSCDVLKDHELNVKEKENCP